MKPLVIFLGALIPACQAPPQMPQPNIKQNALVARAPDAETLAASGIKQFFAPTPPATPPRHSASPLSRG